MNYRGVKEYISDNEGCESIPYIDTKGYWTVGKGHRLPGKPSTEVMNGISDDLIEDLFEQDIITAHMACKHAFGGFDSFPEDAQIVLIDLAFNMGEGSDTRKTGIEGFDNMQKAVEEKNWNEAAWQMLDSKYAKEDVPERGLSPAACGK
jgi:GH24 family phage-related lysozyme (muramidase)